MTPTTFSTRDGGTVTLSAETIEGFSQDVRGPVLFPSDEAFEDATRLWNGMIEKTPALVVRPTGTADVVTAVDFAREHGLSLSVRGGGHNRPARGNQSDVRPGQRVQGEPERQSRPTTE